MASSTREQIIQTTCTLLESQGYHATGLNQIVRESGAPKGSIYYYFPRGKEEIAEAAIRSVTALIVDRIRQNLSKDGSPADVVRAFARNIAHHIEESGYQAGGPLTTVALETATTNPNLNLVCREAYESMRQAFAELLLASRFSADQAASLSTAVLAAMEGGILLSRTAHSGDPMRSVGDALFVLLNAAEK